MTSTNDTTTELHTMSSRAELARQTLRLRAALHEAEEAERAEGDMDPVSARTELSARLAQLMEQRRRQLDADLVAERHRSAMTIDAARREAAALVEHAEQELRLAEAAAAQAAAAGRAAATEGAGAERDPGMAAPTGAAPVIVVLGNDADLPPGAHERQMWVPPANQPGTPTPSAVRPPSLDVDPPVDTPRVATAAPSPASVPARVTAPDPIKVEIDAEAFARVFGTMMVTLMREGGMRHQNPVAPPPKASFWSNARHLDVFLIGTTMVIALLILAAWLV